MTDNLNLEQKLENVTAKARKLKDRVVSIEYFVTPDETVTRQGFVQQVNESMNGISISIPSTPERIYSFTGPNNAILSITDRDRGVVVYKNDTARQEYLERRQIWDDKLRKEILAEGKFYYI